MSETPELDDKDEAVIARLRALPLEGNEPDWAQLARQIGEAVGPHAPRPWWHRWLVPVGALATAAAAALLWFRQPEAVRAPSPPSARDAGMMIAPTAAANTAHAPEAAPLWLDGHLIDMDELAPDAVDEFVQGNDLDETDGLLPTPDLRWVDHLDDQALDRAEAWLDHERS